jgi:hypothetical protein
MNEKYELSENLKIYEKLKILPEDLMFTDLSCED